MLDEFTCLISVSVNRRAGLVEAESCRASQGVSKPTIQHYDKKLPPTDGRIPLYLRSLRSTQFNRTAILLAFPRIIFGRKYIPVPALVDYTSCKESREGTVGKAPR